MTASLFRIPPFPGARRRRLVEPIAAARGTTDRNAAKRMIAEMRRLRVGGTFWGAQPEMDGHDRILACPSSSAVDGAMRAAGPSAALPVRYWKRTRESSATTQNGDLVGILDPWHLFAHCREIWVHGDDPLALLARIAGRAVRVFGKGRFDMLADPSEDATAEAVERHLIAPLLYRDPFSGEVTDWEAIVRLLGEWRALIDRNRSIGAVCGIASWKRTSVAPLMWGGHDDVVFASKDERTLDRIGDARAVAVWKARTSPALLGRIEQGPHPVIEIEDGFIRSIGLGANCVPPLSIVADSHGAHYDPSRASDLELLIEQSDFSPHLLARAAALRRLIVASSISKYGIGGEPPRPGSTDGTTVLVVGQVEDDRSVAAGGGGIGNFELLQRARAREPHARLVYRPHPDVDAGHRKGEVPDRNALTFADAVSRGTSMPSLIGKADRIHVLTSLAGFEALIRDKHVVTHGVPFYAGWGLTEDLGPVPSRRRAKRSVDELVAATLILYPRYLDPVTRLPCSPETLIERLLSGATMQNTGLVALRRLQGLVTRAARRLEQAL